MSKRPLIIFNDNNDMGIDIDKINRKYNAWAILESVGINIDIDNIEYMMDADNYYEARKRLIELISLKDSKFKKLGEGWWLISPII